MAEGAAWGRGSSHLKKTVIVISVLLIVGFTCLALYFTYAPVKEKDIAAPDYSAAVQLPPPEPSAEPKPMETQPEQQETEQQPEPESRPAPVEEEEPYTSPIDFAALWERNPDILAWMDIPNTDISYPIVQSSEDDTFYLTHNSDREYSSDGALFSESTYNTNDFSDLITVVYGHHNFDGTMFANLQKFYSETDAMQDYGLIRVYLPDRELEYEVFATVPYDSVHILYNYGANNLRNKRIFQYEISTVHSLDSRIDSERFPTPADPILILSTCLQGNHDRRFLVLARLNQNH